MEKYISSRNQPPGDYLSLAATLTTQKRQQMRTKEKNKIHECFQRQHE